MGFIGDGDIERDFVFKLVDDICLLIIAFSAEVAGAKSAVFGGGVEVGAERDEDGAKKRGD